MRKKAIRLTEEQYRILYEKGTEPPFCGAYWNNKKEGKYYCAGCRSLLFDSDKKFDSKTGWPSFFAPAKQGAVRLAPDYSIGQLRLEVVCSACGGHLGHVFPDGPPPTGLRYCINSAALHFVGKRRQKKNPKTRS